MRAGPGPALRRRDVLAAMSLGSLTLAVAAGCASDEPLPPRSSVPVEPREPVAAALWRADVLQHSFEEFFTAPPPQLLHNAYPVDAELDSQLNYWWIAHAIDAKVDAAIRTGEPVWAEQGRALYENLVLRNGDSLFNDFFDDMGWLALALVRLAEVQGDDPELLEAAVQLFDHIWEGGWNDQQGGGIAWQTAQPYYKNSPANGPFIIVGHRLNRHLGDQRFLDRADASMRWWRDTLIQEDGFVLDGINRNGDGQLDADWRFTYNQGLYVGACTEAFRTDGDQAWLDDAARTIDYTLAELTLGPVFKPEGDGDGGLFPGIFYRYAVPFLEVAEHDGLTAFVAGSTATLWDNQYLGDGTLRAGYDWTMPAQDVTHMSVQLSAVMAMEAQAALAAR